MSKGPNKGSRFSWARSRTSGWIDSESYTLKRGYTLYAIVQEMRGGWFAYNAGECPISFNTSHELKSFEEAKAYALKAVRKAMKGKAE